MQFEELGLNLTRNYSFTNTLNPDLHRAKHLFPEGIPCDQVIVDKRIEVIDFKIITQNISDHYGLSLTFKI
ncbi:MAG: hypothetical protein Q9M91_04330 [Candidatus Dojkabacteria bacterium]|nr:hypothetical protein [Candidatus Dojkabacteria bacterium]MDQ7021040.1 hypothetical protein [Candidatus Dojkabacteria bacterium]